jgi:hypothetical protein
MRLIFEAEVVADALCFPVEREQAVVAAANPPFSF